MSNDFFEDLGRTISKTAESVGRKTGEVVEVQKLKNQIYSLERSIDKNYSDLGRKIFSKYKGGADVGDDYLPDCEEIESRKAIIKGYEQEISDIKGLRSCHICGASLDKEDVFCKKCGAHVDNI